MRYTIRKTDTGWEIVAGDGTVVSTFTGNDEGAYYDAVAHLGTIVSAERVRTLAATDEAPIEGETMAADDGLLPETWTSEGTPGGGIAFCETLAGGRDFSDCEFSWRDPETGLVPLLLQTENEGGHWGAELAGFVEKFTGGGNATVNASGRFYNNDAGVAFRDMLKNDVRPFFGVSVDPSEAVTVSFECTEMDEYGWCMAGLDKFETYEIAGLTGVPFPGFAQASIRLADSATSTAPAPMRASAAVSVPTKPPRAFFELPEPRIGVEFLAGELGDEFLVDQGDGTLACPLQITEDGRVFGHLSRWGQCHVGDYWGAGVCATAPPSQMGYAPFHVGVVECEDGTKISTGALTVGCEHSDAVDEWKVRDHYANAGSGWADVRVIDGEYGPWVCGVLRPGLSDTQIRVLRALSLSGDWVNVGGNLELVGALAVNTPGFPISREPANAFVMRASAGDTRFERWEFDRAAVDMHVTRATLKASARVGTPTKLVAAGIVQRCPDCQRRQAAQQQAGQRDPRVDQLIELVSTVERRTRHLVPAEAASIAARLAR